MIVFFMDEVYLHLLLARADLMTSAVCRMIMFRQGRKYKKPPAVEAHDWGLCPLMSSQRAVPFGRRRLLLLPSLPPTTAPTLSRGG